MGNPVVKNSNGKQIQELEKLLYQLNQTVLVWKQTINNEYPKPLKIDTDMESTHMKHVVKGESINIHETKEAQHIELFPKPIEKQISEESKLN